MKEVLRDKKVRVLRVNRGEEAMEALRRFCEEKGVKAAVFSFIGAVSEAELWWYDLGRKEYRKKVFEEDLEILGVTGSVATLKGEAVLHAHGTFSDKEYKVVGGHVNRAVVSGACEVVMEELEGEMKREYDEETGLNLL